MSADVKYLGQLETKDSISSQVPSGAGPVPQMGTGGVVLFLIGTWSLPGARLLPK